MKASPGQTTNTHSLEYWGQKSSQHKAQKLTSHASNFFCHLVGVKVKSKHDMEVLLMD